MHDDTYREQQKIEMIRLYIKFLKWVAILGIPYLIGRNF